MHRRWVSTRVPLTLVALVSLAAGPLAAQDSAAVADTAPAATDSASVTRALAAPAPTAAPPADTTFMVDRVLAVVGNRPVLASQVEEEIFSREAQGAKLPTDPDGINAVR